LEGFGGLAGVPARGQAGEIPADAAGAELSLAAAAFPALAVVGGDGAGEAELGDGGDDEPGPAGDLPGVAEGGLVPAQGVLGESIRMFVMRISSL